MSKIAQLYIPLIRDFHVLDIDQFRDKFIQRMSRESFFDALRTYRIVPQQHRLKYVAEALDLMKATNAQKQPVEEIPSSSYLSTIESDKIVTLEKQIVFRQQKKHAYVLRIEKESQSPDKIVAKKRIEILEKHISGLTREIKDLERKKASALLGL